MANVELRVGGVQGHSSAPPAESAIGTLSAALDKLERKGHKARFGAGPEVDTIRYEQQLRKADVIYYG